MKIISKTANDIFETIRSQVQAQQLSPGQTLPPVRQLASELGVNRNTVAAAYKRLVAAGVAETRACDSMATHRLIRAFRTWPIDGWPTTAPRLQRST